MTVLPEEDLTRDAFLGGALHLYQPKRGYRAGVDPVLLAASVPAVTGQRVLELGCGVGAAILCLGARVPGLALTGVERSALYADLARRNGGDTLAVVTADLVDLPLNVRQAQFDHVLANPPYYDRRASIMSDNTAREIARGEGTPLAKWVEVAGKRLTPKGQLHMIFRIERLPEVMRAMPKDVGSLEVLPIAAREGRLADRVILHAKKNGRADFRLCPTLTLHQGDVHEDGDRYTSAIRAVLRAGAALPNS